MFFLGIGTKTSRRLTFLSVGGNWIPGNVSKHWNDVQEHFNQSKLLNQGPPAFCFVVLTFRHVSPQCRHFLIMIWHLYVFCTTFLFCVRELVWQYQDLFVCSTEYVTFHNVCLLFLSRFNVGKIYKADWLWKVRHWLDCAHPSTLAMWNWCRCCLKLTWYDTVIICVFYALFTITYPRKYRIYFEEIHKKNSLE